MLTFLGIGAQRAGTSWLYVNLKRHPEATLPPIKELHFFDEIEENTPTNLVARLSDSHWHNRAWRKKFKYGLVGSMLKGDLDTAIWFSRYLFIPRNLWPASLERYRRLFDGNAARISGDITPAYSILSQQTISIIHEYFPDIRVVFVLRNPVDRTWSQAKRFLGSQRGLTYQEIDRDRIPEFISKPHLRSDYKRTINNWTKYYPKDQVFFGFYDELDSDPTSFYGSILSFLGLGSFSSDKLKERVTVGINKPLPEEYQRILYRKYLNQLEFLAEYFRDYPINYPLKWLDTGKRLLER